MRTLPSETPSVQDIYGRIGPGGTGVIDSPAVEQELTEDQRAALECFYADSHEVSDEEIERMHAEYEARRWERELDDIAAEFLLTYEQYVSAIVQADEALCEKLEYAKAAEALGAA